VARRGKRLKRRSPILPDIAGFVAREEEEEENGGQGRMQRSGAGWLGPEDGFGYCLS
jgi:hypothetical protein